jgi:non-specific serine/threonine protein kinase
MSPVADPALVPQALATVLSIREEPGRPPLSTLVDHVRSKHMLILLDSCEHVVTACGQLANTLLRAAPRLHVLVTSREVLAIAGEKTWRVPSLSMPPPPPPPIEADKLDQYEAVGLFLERATAAKPDFAITRQNAAAVQEICERLDGIPLAIELAAARIRMLSVEQIARRLDDRFRLLTGGNRAALPRQQTMRALVDWSYELLLDAERVVFRRLSVFSGGWTLEAAEAVCASDDLDALDVLDLMMQLVDKSLVVAEEHDGQERYRMLETMRQYALERLAEAGETEEVRGRHFNLFMTMAERATPEEYDTQMLATLGQEYPNVRGALRWAIDHGDSEQALRLAGALWGFWSVRGFYTEGRAWLQEILTQPAATPSTSARVRALQTASHLANCQGDYGAAAVLLEESRTISEELGDHPALAASLHLLGNIASVQGDLPRARALYEEARQLNRATRHPAAEILNLLQLAEVAFHTGDRLEARSLCQDALKTSRDRGQQWAIARALHVLGRIALAEGDMATAASLHQESLGIQQSLGDQQGQVRSRAALARVALANGDAAAARQQYADGLRLARDSHELLEIARALEGLAELDASVEPLRALRLIGAAGAIRKATAAEPLPDELRRMTAWLQPLYASRGEKACAEARAAGRALPLKDVVDEALATS